jgi:hypothetical protein
VELLVAAVIAGARSKAEGSATDAVKDAYAELKRLLSGHEVDVVALERRPDSAVQKATLEEELRAALHAAGENVEQQLLIAGGGALASAMRDSRTSADWVIGDDLGQLETEFIRLQEVRSDGTGVSTQDSETSGAIDIGPIVAGVEMPAGPRSRAVSNLRRVLHAANNLARTISEVVESLEEAQVSLRDRRRLDEEFSELTRYSQTFKRDDIISTLAPSVNESLVRLTKSYQSARRRRLGRRRHLILFREVEVAARQLVDALEQASLDLRTTIESGRVAPRSSISGRYLASSPRGYGRNHPEGRRQWRAFPTAARTSFSSNFHDRPGSSETEQTTVDVVVYLDSTDPAVLAGALASLDDLVRVMGYEGPAEATIEWGSLFRRSKAAAQRALRSDELHDRLVKVERAPELEKIDLKQAEVDNKEAEAVAKLMASVAEIPEVCIRVGALLFIKHNGLAGPVILVRNLSQLELRALERFPEIQKNPKSTMEALATAISSMDDATLQAPQRTDAPPTAGQT